MSRSRRNYILLAVLFAIFVGLGLLGRWGQGAFDPTRDHSSLRTNPWGTKAYRQLLKRCGVDAETWDRPLDELTGRVELLMILDPQRSLSEDEQEGLLDWVRGGGRLVLALYGEKIGRPALACQAGSCGVEGGPDIRLLLARLGLLLDARGASEARARVEEASALTADVSRVIIPSAYRLVRAESNKKLRASLVEHGVEEETVAELEMLEGLEVRTDLACDHGLVLVTIGLGKGRVHVLAEVEILANGEVSEADNVVLAANLVFADGAPERVHFDEYHHYVGRTFGAGRAEVDARPVWWTLWALLAVAAIYAVGRGWRFGAPVVKADEARRSSADYVRAFADIYSRARAGEAALEMLAASFRRSLARAAAVAPSADPLRLEQGLSRRGLPGEEMVSLLSTLERQAEQQTNDGELLRYARAIANYERML